VPNPERNFFGLAYKHKHTMNLCSFLKFADDIVILLTKDKKCHYPVASDFMTLCDAAFLQVNVKKTYGN